MTGARTSCGEKLRPLTYENSVPGAAVPFFPGGSVGNTGFGSTVITLFLLLPEPGYQPCLVWPPFCPETKSCVACRVWFRLCILPWYAGCRFLPAAIGRTTGKTP